MARSPVTIKGISFCRRQARLDRETYKSTERLSSHWVQTIKFDSAAMGGLRSLLASCDLGFDVSRMDDNEVIVQFGYLLDRKSVYRCNAIKEGDAETRPTVRGQTQTVTESVIRVLAAGDKPFSFEGHTLRIIRAEDWRRTREDGQHQIVPAAEARQLIAKLAAMQAVTPEAKSAWQKASELLAEPGLGRFESGLLLLRIVPRRNFKSPSAEPAITPSQLAQLVKEKHWVEIELVDEAGAPVAGVAYSIISPDNQVFTGVTDAAGVARLDNIPAGQCRISFPHLDKDAYKAA